MNGIGGGEVTRSLVKIKAQIRRAYGLRQMLIAQISFFVLLSCGTNAPSTAFRMVQGVPPSQTNPASWSAVGLFDTRTKHVFCSATLIAENIVVTASHCLVNKQPERVGLLFGTSHDDPAADTRGVVEFQAYKPVQKYGSNFDIAWIRFHGSLPEGFRPIEVWRDPSLFGESLSLTIAGYGRTATHCDSDRSPSCSGGRLLTVDTRVEQFIDANRLRNLIVIRPDDPGHPAGPCFGDSGGPAYLKVKGKWYLVGDFMGWDKILVPENRQTICDTGRAIYNYIGGYIDWLEETTSQTLVHDKKQNPTVVLPQPSRDDPSIESMSFYDWCHYANDLHPAWYTTQRLIRMATEFRLAQDSTFRPVDAFLDCRMAEKTVEAYIRAEGRIELLAFDPKRDLKYANIEDIRPLSALSEMGLRELVLYDHDIIDLSPLNALSSLRMIDIRQSSQAHFRNQSLPGKGSEKHLDSALDLSQFPYLSELYMDTVDSDISFDGLNIHSALETLVLKNMAVESLRFIEDTKIQSLTLDRLTLQDVTHFSLPSSLRKLNIKNVNLNSVSVASLRNLEIMQVVNLPDLALALPPSNLLRKLVLHETGAKYLKDIKFYPLLEEISIVSNRQLLSVGVIGHLPRLKRLEVISNRSAQLGGIGYLKNLEELILSGNDIAELNVINELGNLKELIIRENRLNHLGFLAYMPRIETLDISYNPLRNLNGLSSLMFLESLSAENRKSEGLVSIDGMSNLPNLREIDLQSNALRQVDQLIDFPKLEVILLSDNDIVGIESLAVMRNIQYIDLINNPIENKICPFEDESVCRFDRVTISF